MLCLAYFLLWHNPNGVILYCYQKRFSFSFKASLSLPCPSFLTRDFTRWLLEMSIQLFFFSLLFSRYFYSVNACAVCIVLVAIIRLPHLAFFKSMYFFYRCTDDIFNAGESFSSFFPWHLQSTSSLGCKALCIIIIIIIIIAYNKLIFVNCNQNQVFKIFLLEIKSKLLKVGIYR